jgi:molybdate transport system ATP-binding protein
VTTLRSHLVVRHDGFHLDLPLVADAGEVVALLGPNGAGKTTALRALAGLTPLSAGHILLDGKPLHLQPAEHRPVGMVFQDYLLFPHRSVLDNVAFGLRCRGASRRDARREAAAWLERVHLSEYAGKKPAALSGGQAQRVALVRALVTRPRLLLLDEPLAALDAHTKPEIRTELGRHLADFDGAAVLVTHDPLDALVLADRLIIIEGGRLVQAGSPVEVARHPRTDYVARLAGLNFYRGYAKGNRVILREDGLELEIATSLGGPVFVTFPPSAVALYRSRPDGTPRNLWQTRITAIERRGDQVRIHVDEPLAAAADITPAAVAELDLAEGRTVWASVKATETHAYPA